MLVVAMAARLVLALLVCSAHASNEASSSDLSSTASVEEMQQVCFSSLSEVNVFFHTTCTNQVFRLSSQQRLVATCLIPWCNGGSEISSGRCRRHLWTKVSSEPAELEDRKSEKTSTATLGHETRPSASSRPRRMRRWLR